MKTQFVDWQKALVCCAWMAVAGAMAATADAELLVPRWGSQFGVYTERYSNTGTDLGPLVLTQTETLDGLAVSGGNYYAVGNTLGSGWLWRYDLSGTQLQSNTDTLIGMPRGLAVGWNGNLFVGSTFFGGSQITGVLEFNASTLQYVGVAVPLPTPPAGIGTGFAVQDLAFGPDNKLYVAGVDTITRYSQTPLALDAGFSIPASGSVRFRPGDTSVFVAANDEIDRYDSSGALLGTLIAAGSGGMGTIDDFVFGNDGVLYVKSGTGPWSVLRFDGSTGAFLSSFSVGGQIGGMDRIAYVVPEAGSLAMLGSGLLFLGRRDVKRKMWCLARQRPRG